MRKRILALGMATMLTFGIGLGISGCKAGSQVPVQGAVNSFDSNAYLTLVTTDNVIQTCKSDLTAGKFPTNIVGNVKAALNGLIQAYNVANIAYQGYHAAAVAGTATAAQQAAVTNGLNDVQTATTNLIAAKAGS